MCEIFVSTTDPNLVKTTAIPDALGRTVYTVDGMGNTSVNTYDAVGQLVATTDAKGAVTRRKYDERNNLIALIDPVGNTTKWVYDELNRVKQEIDPAGKTKSYEYNARGLVWKMTDRLGRVREYTYDNANRLKTETWKSAGGIIVDQLTYDYFADGRVKSALKGIGTPVGYNFTYDDLGRLKTQADPWGITTTYNFNVVDDLDTVVDSKGGTETSTYDWVHRLTSRNQSGAGVTGLREEFEYDVRDLNTAKRYDASTGGSLIGKTDYGFDNVGRLTNQDIKNGAGTSLVNFVNTYDNANRIKTETRNGVLKSFDYDATSQVTNDGSQTYTYDANGNRTMSGYSTGAANRNTSDGVWNYTYDFEGNLTTKTRISTGEYWEYSWDHRNQLTQVVQKSNIGGSVLQTIQYSWDVFGNMSSRNNNSSVTRYAYRITDNSPGVTKSVHGLWAEMDAANNITTRYLLGDGTGERLARSGSGTTTAWLMQDRIGTVRELQDDSGAIVKSLGYDGFGNLTSETGSASKGSFLYTVAFFDSAAGLYNMHWRMYNAGNGQWLSEDPIGFAAGDANVRRYVGNNALNGVDLTGLEEKEIKLKHPKTGDDIGILMETGWSGSFKSLDADKKDVPVKDAFMVKVTVPNKTKEMTRINIAQFILRKPSDATRIENGENYKFDGIIPGIGSSEYFHKFNQWRYDSPSYLRKGRSEFPPYTSEFGLHARSFKNETETLVFADSPSILTENLNRGEGMRTYIVTLVVVDDTVVYAVAWMIEAQGKSAERSLVKHGQFDPTIKDWLKGLEAKEKANLPPFVDLANKDKKWLWGYSVDPRDKKLKPIEVKPLPLELPAKK